MNEPAAVSSEDRATSRPVFISYATADRKEALGLCKAIERRRTKCWISTRDVAPGENYQEAIVRSLRGARAMVLVFSEAANNSDEIKKELSLASRYHIPVIAVRIEDVEPTDAFAYELSTRQWIDAFAGWDRSLDSLVRRIGELPGAAVAAAPEPQTTTRRRVHLPLRRSSVAIASALLLVLAGSAWWLLRPSPASHSMVVRYGGFQRLSADLPTTMPDAIRDEIIAAFNDQGQIAISTAPAAAAGTAPAYALGGTLRSDGDHVRVITRLTNERSGATLWSDSFDYDAGEVQRIPRLIALDSGNMVRCGLDGASTYPKALPDGVMSDYMQFCQNSWAPTGGDGGKALDAARRVVAAAPDFSWGWSAITRASADEISGPGASAARAEGIQAAHKALAIDPGNSEALAWEATLTDPKDRIGQEKLFKQSLAARPLACGCEHYLYGYFLQDVGRYGDAIAEFRHATEMLSLNWFSQFALGDALNAIGKPDEAKSHLEAAVELNPDPDFAGKAPMFEALESSDYKAAIRALSDQKLKIPLEKREAMMDGYRALASGDAVAREMAIKALVAIPEDQKSPIVTRMVAVLGGEHEAMKLMVDGVNKGRSDPSDFWYQDLRAVRSDPKFTALVSRLGLVSYWRSAHVKPDVCSEGSPPPLCRMI